MALDESTEISFTAQLEVFLGGVDNHFNITEELAAIFLIKATTRSIDLWEGVMPTIKRLGLSLSKLSKINSDGVPSMIGKY